MKTRAKLLLLELIGGTFGLTWIGAAIASVYFLYGALVSEASVYFLLLSIGVGLIAKSLAVVFNSRKEQVDYVDQLMERGYTQAEAQSAWLITINGGSNLLLNLQQADAIVEMDSTV